MEIDANLVISELQQQVAQLSGALAVAKATVTTLQQQAADVAARAASEVVSE